MSAAVVYYLRLLAYRQSVIPPVLLYLALLGMIFATDAGPAVPVATVTAAALMPVSAWLMRLTALTETRPFAEMSAVALGSATRRLLARAAAASVVGMALSVASVAWALVANPHPYPMTTVALVGALHLAQVVAGVGIGALVAPPLRATAGLAAVAISVIVLLSLLIRWVPPLAPTLYHLERTPLPGALTVLLAVGQAPIVGGLALAAAAALGRRAG